MYFIARLNLAINNKQSEKFWYGINDKASMGQYEKELGEYRELEKIMGGGLIGEFSVV